MKIALCLYGMSFPYKNKMFDLTKTAKVYHEKLINKYDVDIFCHFYINNTETEEIINDLYSPKKYECEFKSDKHWKGKKRTTRIRSKEYDHLYSVYRSNQLRLEYEKEKNITYDLVIMTRYDLNLRLNRDLNTYDKNKIYLADRLGTKKARAIKNHTYCMDVLFMANSENMTKIAEMYLYLENFHKSGSIHEATGNYLRSSKLIKKAEVLNPKEFYVMVFWNYYPFNRKKYANNPKAYDRLHGFI